MMFIVLYLISFPCICVAFLSTQPRSMCSSSRGPVVYTEIKNSLMNIVAKSKYSITRFHCTSKDAEKINNSGKKKSSAKRNGTKISSRGNASRKVEAEIEEVKQAIKEVELLIVSVGQEIKSTEEKLLAGNLSPSIESILTTKFNGLMKEKKDLRDKEKALMDKEKFLRDKEKGLVDKEKGLVVKEKTTTLHPFEFSMILEENFPESGGGMAIFKREWLCNDIADMVLKQNGAKRYNSYYWRAPAGSGKTVFLNLIGKNLQDRGCVVYYIDDSYGLDHFTTAYYYELCRNAGDKTVVLMIDEVHNNLRTVVWTGNVKKSLVISSFWVWVFLIWSLFPPNLLINFQSLAICSQCS